MKLSIFLLCTGVHLFLRRHCVALLSVHKQNRRFGRIKPFSSKSTLFSERNSSENTSAQPQHRPHGSSNDEQSPATNSVFAYTNYWDDLLLREHEESAEELRNRRKTWSRSRLEASGMSIFYASVEPESEIFGEKIVRVHHPAASISSKTRWRDLFARGDVLVLTSMGRDTSRAPVLPRECSIVDVGNDWLTAAVGSTWPQGVWESRKSTDMTTLFRLDRTAPQVPLRAQRCALEMLNRGKAGEAAELMARTFLVGNQNAKINRHEVEMLAARTPSRFMTQFSTASHEDATGTAKSSTTMTTNEDVTEITTTNEEVNITTKTATTIKKDNFVGTTNTTTAAKLEIAIWKAMEKAKSATRFKPNVSQMGAISWALQRRISLIRGPPGTGKTRVAALLISTALKLEHPSQPHENNTNPSKNNSNNTISSPTRILAVAHSNGAADVLLEALLQMGVPAVRMGRPSSVSSKVLHRTVVAISEKMPEMQRLRRMSTDMNLHEQARSSAAFDMRTYRTEVQKQIVRETAPVVVTSCISAHQLMLMSDEEDNSSNSPYFSLVVLDEAAQTTEPALLCALAAAKAQQLIMVGDTKQLPPTVTSVSQRNSGLSVSPMARLEKLSGQVTLRVQYRMPPSLLEHPSKYFYGGLVTTGYRASSSTFPPPGGFPWPAPSLPLAFVDVGNGESEVAHNLGGRTNPTEAALAVKIVCDLVAAGDVGTKDIAIISPYAKQVQLLRTELSSCLQLQIYGDDVRVGTVDSFQGQETKVVLFSAVRSNGANELGFLRDCRRLCVAITRARRALLLVGDRSVLQTCRHWSALIESCEERGCVMDGEELLQKYDRRRRDEQLLLLTRASSSDSSMAGLPIPLDDDYDDDEMFGLFDKLAS